MVMVVPVPMMRALVPMAAVAETQNPMIAMNLLSWCVVSSIFVAVHLTSQITDSQSQLDNQIFTVGG